MVGEAVQLVGIYTNVIVSHICMFNRIEQISDIGIVYYLVKEDGGNEN